MNQSGFARALVVTLLLAVSSTNVHAQDATDLAKQTQNPVADLAAFPSQFNYTSGGDLDANTLLVLNFQPVIPLRLNANWNVITRTIVPYGNVPLPGGERSTGIGDIQQQLFFAPAEAAEWVWGVGPTLSYPTATNAALETGQFGAGPTAVVVHTSGNWVVGSLASQLWRIAGERSGPELNQALIQPFINYNLQGGWSISFAPLITANWSAPSGEEWTVPLGLGISKVDTIGRQPVNLSVQYYNNVERPGGAGEHTVRFVFAFLFPRSRAPQSH